MDSSLNKKRGVSSVVGVILLVALTVSLSALATFVIFDFGDDSISETPEAEAKLVEKEGKMVATIINNENVDKFTLQGPNGSTENLNNVGDQASLQDGNGVYDLIASTGTGTEQVIIQSVGRTVFYKEDTVNLTIVVENATDSSSISGAFVDVYDITNTTNSSGEAQFDLEDGTYTVNVNSDDYKEKNVDVTVNGDTTKTIQLDPDDTTVSGTVSTNPMINDATVKAKLNDGSTIQTTTNSNGKYSFSKSPSGVQSIYVNANGEDQYNGNDFYASAKRNVSSSQFTVNFTFVDRIYRTINGTTVVGSFDISEKSVTNDHMIGNVHQLQLMKSDLNEDYKLISDIDATATNNWDSEKGFDPIGKQTSKFKGSLDGNNKTIDKLHIDRNSTSYVGVFGYTGAGSVIENITITEGNISGKSVVGGLIGRNDGAEVDKIEYNGNVSSPSDNIVGGIIGRNTNAYRFNSLIFNGTVKSSSGDNIGGIIGKNTGGDITKSYMNGSVVGNKNVGGIIGSDRQGNHDFIFKSGSTEGSSNNIGSIIGKSSRSEITYVYSDDTVGGNKNVSGIVGYLNESSSMNYTYSATDTSSGSLNVGSIVGTNEDSDVNVSYWNNGISTSAIGKSSGTSTSTNINGLTETEMKGDSADTNMDLLDFGSGGEWGQVNSTDPDSSVDDYPILSALDRQKQIDSSKSTLKLEYNPAPSELLFNENKSINKEDGLVTKYDFKTSFLGSFDADYTSDGVDDMPIVDDNGDLVVFSTDGTTTEIINSSNSISPKRSKSRIAVSNWKKGNRIYFVSGDKKIYNISKDNNVNFFKNPSNGVSGLLGSTEIDGDSNDEFVFLDGSQQLRYIESDGSTSKITGGQVGSNNNGLGISNSFTDYNNDGTYRAIGVDGSNNIFLANTVDSTTKISATDAKKSAVTADDIDSDDEKEILYIDKISSNIKYVDDVLGSNTINTFHNSTGYPIKATSESGMSS